MNFRIGFGFDVHPLSEDRQLVLGGIEIPHEKGALGHSDADVLIHAICDAILGAANLGDIGKHFPDTDHTLRNISSLVLLGKVREMLTQKRYRVVNIDSTVCLQRPKIQPYIPQMAERMSGAIKIPREAISIKATTTEMLGFIGREEGVSAYAVALIEAV